MDGAIAERTQRFLQSLKLNTTLMNGRPGDCVVAGGVPTAWYSYMNTIFNAKAQSAPRIL
jgi:hypothetical protein